MKTETLSPVSLKSLSRSYPHEDHRLPEILSGVSLITFRIRMLLSIIRIVMTNYRDPADRIKGILFLLKLRKEHMALPSPGKILKFDQKYFQGLYVPPLQSESFNNFIKSELYFYKPLRKQPYRYTNVFFAITKKCPLQCEHCYEGDLLNQKEQYANEQIMNTIEGLQQLGVCNIHLSGGEPLLKTNLIIKILKSYGKISNFWINTSGFSLSEEKAKAFQKSGLMGVIISLDHYEKEKHNHFRNFKSAYQNALEGIKNALKANLVVAVSVCVTRETCNTEFLQQFMHFTKDLGVHFVQILEPRLAGNYKNMDVMLNPEELQTLEKFYVSMNYGKTYQNYPIVVYHGYSQRRAGCLNGFKRGFYIDSNGDVKPCMFCTGSRGNIYKSSILDICQKMSSSSCPTY